MASSLTRFDAFFFLFFVFYGVFFKSKEYLKPIHRDLERRVRDEIKPTLVKTLPREYDVDNSRALCFVFVEIKMNSFFQESSRFAAGAAV